MKPRKRPSETMVAVLLLSGAALLSSPLLARSAFADIYRWEDETGVIHFTDDRSTIPAKFRGTSREILKTPPAGKPSVSTMGAPSRIPEPSPTAEPEPEPGNGQSYRPPGLTRDDGAVAAEKLRAKIDAKERFLRDVDEKQSLATNPYRNRFVSPSDLELYRKYKEELPADRERLKALESSPPPVNEP